MPESLGSALLELRTDDAAFVRGIRSAEGQAKNLETGLTRLQATIITLNQAFQFTERVAGTAGRALGAIAEAGDQFRRAEIMLTRLMGSAEAARDQLDRFKQIAAVLPVSIDKMTEGFVRLQAVGFKESERMVLALTDAVAAFGGTGVEMQRAIIGIQQIASKGVVSMEELRQQVGEAIPGSLTIMARELGYGQENLKDFFKLIETGGLPAKEGLDALLRGLEKDFAGASEAMSNTWAGATTQMGSAWLMLKANLAETGMLDLLIQGIKLVSNAMLGAKIQIIAFQIAWTKTELLLAHVSEGMGKLFGIVNRKETLEAAAKRIQVLEERLDGLRGELLEAALAETEAGGALARHIDASTEAANTYREEAQALNEAKKEVDEKAKADKEASDDFLTAIQKITAAGQLAQIAVARMFRDFDQEEVARAMGELSPMISEGLARAFRDIDEEKVARAMGEISPMISEGLARAFRDIDEESVAQALEAGIRLEQDFWDRWGAFAADKALRSFYADLAEIQERLRAKNETIWWEGISVPIDGALKRLFAGSEVLSADMELWITRAFRDMDEEAINRALMEGIRVDQPFWDAWSRSAGEQIARALNAQIAAAMAATKPEPLSRSLETFYLRAFQDVDMSSWINMNEEVKASYIRLFREIEVAADSIGQRVSFAMSEFQTSMRGPVFAVNQLAAATQTAFSTIITEIGSLDREIESVQNRITGGWANMTEAEREAADAQLQALIAARNAAVVRARDAFETNKAMQIAQAIINTVTSATQALAFPPGPPVSFAYVAAALTAGFAYVDQIRAQQFIPPPPAGFARGGVIGAGDVMHMPGLGADDGFLLRPVQVGETVVPRGGAGPSNQVIIHLEGSEAGMFSRKQVRSLIEQLRDVLDDDSTSLSLVN